ncbi:FHA domain-containing protein [Morus notabilis]|uniref:FHA domain-containing protein n=1 Tax=Morus notabilis TaxID=981085 RepID=W9R6B4_9ROSA|nr:FHA domain-containing protein At4g14490 [Morus notabilis]EXB55546.1 FHA domain-containing protein [Morus notabilis]
MAAMALKLVVTNGPREGETLEYKPGATVRIGRIVRGNNLPIKDSGISSKHLTIGSESGKWILRDLDSSNGTFLNDKQIDPNAAVDLRDGDVVKIGEQTSISVKIDEFEGSQLWRNPRRGVEKSAVDSVAASRGGRGRVLKESEENCGLAVDNSAEVVGNRRRGRPRKVGVLNINVEEEEELCEVQKNGEVFGSGDEKLEEKQARQASTRRTRSSKMSKDDEIVASGSVLQNIPENDLAGREVGVGAGCGTVEERPVRQVSTRRKQNSKSSKNDESVVSDSFLVVIPEIYDLEGGEVEVVAKKKRMNTRRGRNLPPKKPPQSVLIDISENSEDKIRVDAANYERVNVSNLGEQDGIETVSYEEGNEDACRNVGSSDEAKEGIGSGSGSKENSFEVGKGVDLEKMTLGEWFDFLEVTLPKQIIEATEEMIMGMRLKAKRVHEYTIQQKSEMAKVLVG